MKTFTVRDLKKLGLDHVPSLDFSDDGTNFKIFMYNGLPVSYAKANGEYYISVRFDYVDGLSYSEYSKFESYSLANDFNGIDYDNLDTAQLLENLKMCLDELYDWQVTNNK